MPQTDSPDSAHQADIVLAHDPGTVIYDPTLQQGPGIPRKLWLHARLLWLRGKRGMAQSSSQRAPGQMRTARYGRMDPRARMSPGALLVQAKIDSIEARLGITRAGRTAYTGDQLERAVDTHADSLARWREEDERLGRKK